VNPRNYLGGGDFCSREDTSHSDLEEEKGWSGFFEKRGGGSTGEKAFSHGEEAVYKILAYERKRKSDPLRLDKKRGRKGYCEFQIKKSSKQYAKEITTVLRRRKDARDNIS